MRTTRSALLLLVLAVLAAGAPALLPGLARAGTDEATQKAEELAAEQAEQAAEAAAEAAAQEAEAAQEAAEKAAEAAAEAAAREAENAAEIAAQQAEATAEQAADEAALEVADDAAEGAAQAAEQQAEHAVEQAADEAAHEAEDAAEQAAEGSVEHAVDQAADDAAQQAEETAEQAGEDSASEAEETAGRAAEEAVEGAVQDAAERAGDNELTESRTAERPDIGEEPRAGARDNAEHERAEERHGANRMRNHDPSTTDPDIPGMGVDDRGEEIALGEWLVMASPDEIAALEKLGYVARSLEPLQGIGRVLAHMEAPASFDIAAAQRAVRSAAPNAGVDLNHLYRTESAPAETAAHATGTAPRTLYPLIDEASGAGLRIGMIDTSLDPVHPAFSGAHVRARDFVPYTGARPQAHGTLVASILVGQGPEGGGLLPRAELLAASVFFTTPSGGNSASTASLVRALDWMATEHVAVVNMSLAGPANDILEAAITRIHQLGVPVVAAVGNRGPSAKPLYPAAWPSVVAVTATDAAQRVYRLANRGPQVDFAAPGVNVRAASTPGTGFGATTGTSMAAPFVTAVIAVSCSGGITPDACVHRLEAGALDLGTPGPDPVFGYGLVRPVRS